MLQIRGLKKSYDSGRVHALDGLNMTIEDGSLYGFVGPNGAGKTTAIRAIAGLLVPDDGSIMTDGIDALKEPAGVHDIIGYVPDSFGSYDNLTVREYMEFFASAYNLTGLTARKRCLDLLGQVGLDDRLDHYVDSLSRGMQQRLCLARALIHDPRFLVMDEPTSGLDPGSRYEFRGIMRELHEQGKTVLISSHILSELSLMCTDLGIVESGRMVIEGSMEDIMERVEASNPVRISIMDGEKDALSILRRNPCVRSISTNGHTFLVNFIGSREDEAVLLMSLVSADIPVREFVREAGSLESFFMQITDHSEEKVIMQNDY